MSIFLEFFLTSLEPGLSQNNYSQSLGGYCSLSNLYQSSTLGADLDINSQLLTLSSYTNLSGYNYININNEIINVNPITSNSVSVISRSINGVKNAHLQTDSVFGLNTNQLFNNTFNNNLTQYYCIALKNTSTSQAYNMSLFFENLYSNLNSNFNLALEIPSSIPLMNKSSTGGSVSTLIDSSLINVYSDNYFINAYLTILSGNNINQARTISSFDKATGTFVFNASLPYAIVSGVQYKVDAGPAQRIGSQVMTPIFNTTNVSALTNNQINLNFNNNRSNGNNLGPQEVVYIWMQRSLTKSAQNIDLNSIALSVNYFSA